MRRDVQEIFRLTPHEKQVMMFSATLSKEIRPVCRKFMQDVSYQHLLIYQIEPTASFSHMSTHCFLIYFYYLAIYQCPIHKGSKILCCCYYV